MSERRSPGGEAAGDALAHPDPVPLTRVAPSFKYGAEAFAMLGIAFGLLKWVGRNLRSLISDSAMESARVEAIVSSTPAAAADALVRQGLVSPQDLAGMTPRERDFLITTTVPLVDTVGSRGGARPPTPVSSSTVAPRVAARSTPATTRLHLITPSRPPLGMAVHCPGCGMAVDREAVQRFGETDCPRCKRKVSAHIQRGRLTVIVDETPEEGDHRRRMDGSQ